MLRKFLGQSRTGYSVNSIRPARHIRSSSACKLKRKFLRWCLSLCEFGINDHSGLNTTTMGNMFYSIWQQAWGTALCLNSLTRRLVIFLVWRLGLRAKAVYADVFAHHYCVSRFFFSCLRHSMSYDLRNSIMMRDVVYAFPVEFISFNHNAYTISRIIMPLLRSYHVSCRKLIAPFTLTVLERRLS